MSRHPECRAFTVLEVLVSAAVLSMLLGAIYLALIYGFRHLQQTLAYSDVQQQGKLAMRSLKDDLGETHLGKFVYAADEAAMISPKGLRSEADSEVYTYSGAGLLQFRGWVGYYRTAAGELRRAEIDINPDIVLPNPAAAPAAASFTAVTGPLVKTVARHLTQFEVTPDTSIQTLRVTITLRKAVNSTRNTQLSLTTQVRARH